MKTLAQKIAAVTAAVKHPPQSGHNKFHNYKYSTRDDIFGVIRGELAERGVAVLPSVMSVERDSTGRTSKSGAVTMRFAVRVSIVMVDSETGEEAEQIWEGESHTEDDKGVPQAVTQALRFWATNTFMLLDGSDEQMYGKPGTQAPTSSSSGPPPQKVNRQQASAGATDAKSHMAARLKGLGFELDDVKAFFAYIADSDDAADIDAVHPGKLKMWADRMNNASDEQVNEKVKVALKTVGEAPAERGAA